MFARLHGRRWSPRWFLPIPALFLALYPTATGYHSSGDTLPFFAAAVVEAGEPAVDVPVQIDIPVIGVSAAIEQMGITPEGNLEAPRERLNAGWYAKGARPGETGTSIIDGHLDLEGKPGVFWRLRDVRPGDEVHVTDAAGVVRRFRVRETQVYDVETAPLHVIFGQSQDEHLHLITCAGTWDTRLGHYDKRLVVFAEAIKEEQEEERR